ncbi:transposase family protein [bacterium]|nr:transposase family protein [bacterium]
MVLEIHSDWLNQRVKRLNKNNPNRIRKIGGGRKKILSTLEDQLLLALVWAKLYPSYLILEYFFGVDESTVCRTIQEIILLLQSKFILLKRRKGKKITTIEELKEIIPDLDEILTDARKQKIPRPRKKQKERNIILAERNLLQLKLKLLPIKKDSLFTFLNLFQEKSMIIIFLKNLFYQRSFSNKPNFI